MRFVRVHRSAMVNLESVLRLAIISHGEFEVVLKKRLAFADQPYCKSLFFFVKWKMAGIVEPDESLLRSLDSLALIPNPGRTTSGVMPSFKKEDRFAEVEPESIKINERKVWRSGKLSSPVFLRAKLSARTRSGVNSFHELAGMSQVCFGNWLRRALGSMYIAGSVSLSRKLLAKCSGKGVEYAHLHTIWFDSR